MKIPSVEDKAYLPHYLPVDYYDEIGLLDGVVEVLIPMRMRFSNLVLPKPSAIYC
jgi:hypothetical protein